MLTTLSIKNYALIEDIQMNLQTGFTTITGETGAGKSIMLGALSLLLGKRADFSVIRDPSKKCVIEGTFEISGYNLKELFIQEDLDFEPVTIIRREILPSGKSRAFINDTPANLSSLQLLGEKLIDIHSQHETLVVGESDFQFLVVDALATNQERLLEYRKELGEFHELQKKLREIREAQAQAAKDYDYNQFLLTELEQARLEVGLQEFLEERYEELSNVEELREQLGSAVQLIQQEDIGGANTLREARNNLQRISGISAQYSQLFERLNSLNIELDDIAMEMEAALEKIEADPDELEKTSAKLQMVYGLQKKHSVATVAELIQISEELSRKVAVSENAEEDIKATEAELDRRRESLKTRAEVLHSERKKVLPVFITEVKKILSDLGMPNADLKIRLEVQESFNSNGSDIMSWQFSANKGGNFNELRKAASGGELSRIMLAVKSILTNYSNLPTIIFDEIDTGVSGEIANRMGEILRKMGQSMQVIAITHLPQIAGKGKYHFRIFKKEAENSTSTHIVQLQGAERVREIASMLGGENISDSAVAHAKALLN